MSHKLKLILLLTLTSTLVLIAISILLIIFIIIHYKTKKHTIKQQDIETTNNTTSEQTNSTNDQDHHHILDNFNTKRTETENLVTFQGGQDLTISDILDAPGEVIGKSSYGTLYKAFVQRSNCVRLLRFLRPAAASCSSSTSVCKEVLGGVVQVLGCVRNPNLVPLLGFYKGPRGEKLLVHPFFRRGNLSQFIRDGNNGESHKWTIIYKISIGIAKGLDHLHTGLQKPIVHGNLKSKNVLLDRNYQPYISDFGLHLLLNPAAGQEVLEVSAIEGYKAPELIKMKDVSPETDIYSLGIIFLELLSGKEPVAENPSPDEDFYLPIYMRNAVLDRRISELYHPSLLVTSDNEAPVSEECLLKFFQLAMSCCSPSPSLRPNTKQVLEKLEEIGRLNVHRDFHQES